MNSGEVTPIGRGEGGIPKNQLKSSKYILFVASLSLISGGKKNKNANSLFLKYFRKRLELFHPNCPFLDHFKSGKKVTKMS